jgi:hypothetical protein
MRAGFIWGMLLHRKTIPVFTDTRQGGLARKKREDLLEVEGIGEKGITEIKKVLI